MEVLFQQPSPGVLLTQLYLFGDQQPVRVLDGRALVQQQGLELPLLNVIESVKHNSQKQVHDEVELNGEIHNEEDTGPGIPGIGRHHHIREI